jgi:hypothetical protein
LISRLVQRVILPANPAQISKVGLEPGIHPTEQTALVQAYLRHYRQPSCPFQSEEFMADNLGIKTPGPFPSGIRNIRPHLLNDPISFQESAKPLV